MKPSRVSGTGLRPTGNNSWCGFPKETLFQPNADSDPSGDSMPLDKKVGVKKMKKEYKPKESKTVRQDGHTNEKAKETNRAVSICRGLWQGCHCPHPA